MVRLAQYRGVSDHHSMVRLAQYRGVSDHHSMVRLAQYRGVSDHHSMVRLAQYRGVSDHHSMVRLAQYRGVSDHHSMVRLAQYRGVSDHHSMVRLAQYRGVSDHHSMVRLAQYRGVSDKGPLTGFVQTKLVVQVYMYMYTVLQIIWHSMMTIAATDSLLSSTQDSNQAGSCSPPAHLRWPTDSPSLPHRTLIKQGPYGGKSVVRRALVITPGSLVKNWECEFRKWLGTERLHVFAISGENRVEVGGVNVLREACPYTVYILIFTSINFL